MSIPFPVNWTVLTVNGEVSEAHLVYCEVTSSVVAGYEAAPPLGTAPPALTTYVRIASLTQLEKSSGTEIVMHTSMSHRVVLTAQTESQCDALWDTLKAKLQFSVPYIVRSSGGDSGAPHHSGAPYDERTRQRTQVNPDEARAINPDDFSSRGSPFHPRESATPFTPERRPTFRDTRFGDGGAYPEDYRAEASAVAVAPAAAAAAERPRQSQGASPSAPWRRPVAAPPDLLNATDESDLHTNVSVYRSLDSNYKDNMLSPSVRNPYKARSPEDLPPAAASAFPYAARGAAVAYSYSPLVPLQRPLNTVATSSSPTRAPPARLPCQPPDVPSREETVLLDEMVKTDGRAGDEGAHPSAARRPERDISEKQGLVLAPQPSLLCSDASRSSSSSKSTTRPSMAGTAPPKYKAKDVGHDKGFDAAPKDGVFSWRGGVKPPQPVVDLPRWSIDGLNGTGDGEGKTENGKEKEKRHHKDKHHKKRHSSSSKHRRRSSSNHKSGKKEEPPLWLPMKGNDVVLNDNRVGTKENDFFCRTLRLKYGSRDGNPSPLTHKDAEQGTNPRSWMATPASDTSPPKRRHRSHKHRHACKDSSSSSSTSSDSSDSSSSSSQRSSLSKKKRKSHSRSSQPRTKSNKKARSPKGTSADLYRPQIVIKHNIRGKSRPTEVYIFATLDKQHIVAVKVADYTKALQRSGMLSRYRAQRRILNDMEGAERGIPVVGISDIEKAQTFFRGNCRALAIRSILRVTIGTDEPYVEQDALVHHKPRFLNRSKLACILTSTHGFFLEFSSAELAADYVELWNFELKKIAYS